MQKVKGAEAMELTSVTTVGEQEGIAAEDRKLRTEGEKTGNGGKGQVSPPSLPSEEQLAELERLIAERAIVEVDVLERVRGGLQVRFGELVGFLPTSLATAKRYPSEGEVRQLLGQRIHVVCHELRKDPTTGDMTLIFSHRHFLEDLALARLHVGDVVEGTVTRLTTLGAFVDIGGLEGFIPLSELDHLPVPVPNKVLSVGDTVRVQVLSIDLPKRRVRLSRKALLPSPWEGVEERYPVGSRVRGIVRRVVPRAAFVQLEPGIEGIVPVEELSWTQPAAHPAQFLSAGQELEFVVTEVSSAQKRIVLSLRRAQPNPWEQVRQRYPVGSRVEVTVRRLSPTAAIVELEDGLPAVIPAAELSWTHPRPQPSNILQPGQRIPAIVLQVEPERRTILLSYRQTQPDPWSYAEERFPVGSYVQGTVRRLLPRSAIVELADGIEGFIPLSELSWTRRPSHPAELLSAGQQVQCVVTEVSAADRRLVLSLRKAQPNPWDSLHERYPVGSEQEATVVELRQAGALVRLSGEIDAFMPRSTFAHLLRKTRQPWKSGDTLRVRIVELKSEELSLIVEPLLEQTAPARPKPTAPPQSTAGTSPPSLKTPPHPRPAPTRSPARREEKRTGTTLADLLPEEVLQKLQQNIQLRRRS